MRFSNPSLTRSGLQIDQHEFEEQIAGLQQQINQIPQQKDLVLKRYLE
jgi:hypothetical protein